MWRSYGSVGRDEQALRAKALMELRGAAESLYLEKVVQRRNKRGLGGS